MTKTRNFTKNTNDEQRPNNNIETSENNEARSKSRQQKYNIKLTKF